MINPMTIHSYDELMAVQLSDDTADNGTYHTYLNIYCSNYKAVDAPVPGTDAAPTIPEVTLLSDTSVISQVTQYERFRPMIKLPGMNGYVKILERCPIIPVRRSADGSYEVVYHVEFPYCPGSYSVRRNMDFADDAGNYVYKTAFVLKKSSYINAGSWALDSLNHYDIANDRHVPFSDDSFCQHSFLSQYAQDGILTTASESNGGGILNVPTDSKNLVEYPASLIWSQEAFSMLSLTKPRNQDYRRYGTYDVRVLTNGYNYNKDAKLMALVDNRVWRYGANKFLSYINRENPSYICEMDVSALFNDYTKNQKDHASLPDTKRWLYTQFSGFAHMLLTPDLTIDDYVPENSNEIITEKVSTIKKATLVTFDSGSDIVIEIWDNKSLLGSLTRAGNWRPLSPVNTDSEKVADLVVVGNVYLDYSIGATLQWGNIYTVSVGYIDSNGPGWPPFVGFGGPNDILNDKENLVLFDTKNNRTFHIAHVENWNGNYKVYINCDVDPSTVLDFTDPHNFELKDAGQYSICRAKKNLNKDISFKMNTSEVVQDIAGNLLTKFVDILSTFPSVKTNPDNPSDAARYIGSDNKIFFRVRVVKKKNYSISYKNSDESTIQYLWTTETPSVKTNSPWWNPLAVPAPAYYTAFDWTRIKAEESVEKFGMTYFKTESK